MAGKANTVWTIGHSTRTIGEFISLLNAFQIQMIVDVRHFPGSRKFPQFNKDSLAASLAENSISYKHIIELGGRRKPAKESKNTAWRHPAFRAYADYMETADFAKGVGELTAKAAELSVAYMCSEAVWWRCHRALISDLLKVSGWQVLHIMSLTKAEEHPFTSPAVVVNGRLSYVD